jgi:hypothetical protein
MLVRRIPTFAGLNLKEPYRHVNGDAQRSASLFELVDGKLGERYALAGANLLINTATISICQGGQQRHDAYP